MNTRGKRPKSVRRSHAYFLSFILMTIPSILTSSCRPPVPSYQGYGYLIIAPEALLQAVEDFGNYKEAKGFLVDLVSLEEILTSTPGDDDPEKIRNYLQGYSVLTPEREFVLLVGSMYTIPMRIAYPDPYDRFDVPTDFYYEDLTGNWDADGDGFFGEYGEDMSKETEDYSVELYVARIPWDDPGQVQAIFDRIIQYEEDASPRMNRAIGAAATIEAPCDTAPWVGLGKLLIMDPAGYETTTLYENCPSEEPDYELTQHNFLGQWEIQQPALVTWFSHGSSYRSCLGPPNYDTFIDADNLPQAVAPAVCLTSGCTVAAPDVESLGRVLIHDGICASFMGSSRETEWGDDAFPAYNSQFKMITHFIWRRRALSEAKRFSLEYYAMAETVPDNIDGAFFHKNLFQFMVFGDPSIQLR
jgi:hypothetical protein